MSSSVHDMRRIINSTYITLDGVIEGPHLWPSLGRPGDERFGQIQTDLALSCDALLMGRRTYDGFAPVWPTRSGDPFSDHINRMPKYVVSTTLKDPEWTNTQVIDGDVRRAGRTAQAGPRQGHRPVLGRGSPSDLLFGAAPAVGFHLTDTTTLSDGIVILTYQTDKTLAEAA